MRFALAAALAVLLSTSGGAHEKFKIVGTVAKVHAEQLDVKSVDGSTYEMDMADSVAVFRQNRKAPKSELKPGVKVTVHALGHDFFDLEVTEIHITQ
jgi:Cu/Ag efflux protein CusF